MAISLKALQSNYQLMNNTSNDPTHQYFNMGVFNEYTQNNTQSRPLVFNQTKQFIIVDKADDYYLSIIRWNLQSNLPVLIPDIQIKPTPEIFTGLTDYQLALLYTSESSSVVPNTFGLVSASGNNYNGEFKNGKYGFDKLYNINFVPDNSNCVDYDNYNNGLSSNGSENGSIYIISGGVLKVFDKTSSSLIYTLTPSSGNSYKFICCNKTTGNFYIGLTSNSNNNIEYIEYTRATASTWTIGGSYTSVSNKNNVAGICVIGSNLYEFSYDQSLPDTLYGNSPTNSLVYNVNNNIVQTIYPTKSSVIITPGRAYGIGDDNLTYYIPYPITPPEPWQGPINEYTLLKAGCLWSNQTTGDLFSMGTTNTFNVWNFTNSPNFSSPQNSWSSVGELDINYPTVTAISVDLQPSTNQLIVVGSNNDLYISTNPVAPIEYIYSSGDPNIADYNYGLSLWNPSTGQQNTYQIHNFNNQFGNHTQLFKHQNRIFVPEYQGSTQNVNLVIYSIKDWSVVSTQTNFSTNGITTMSPMPLASKFIYCDASNNLVVCSLSTYATLETNTFFVGSGLTPMQICELDSTHYVVCTGNQSVFIFQYGNISPINTITAPYNCGDVAVINVSSFSTDPNQLFLLCGNNISYNEYRGNYIYLVEFLDTTYTAIAGNPSVIYSQTSQDRYITYLDFQQDQLGLNFIESIYSNVNYTYSNKQLKTLFYTEGYDNTKIAYCNLDLGNNSYLYLPTKNYFYLCQSTMSSHRWTQITSNIQVKAVSVSQSNNNNLYCLGSVDSRIYGGELNSNSITLTKYKHLTQTYNYISNSGLSSIDTQNLISEWTSTGDPTSINIIDNSPVSSTSPNRSSFITNGTSLYALYDNLNNVTKINQINPSTFISTNSAILTNKILNGLVGFDENSNIVISNVNQNIKLLLGLNSSSLLTLYNNVDPSADFNTSTMNMYPYVKSVTTTNYNLASDGCINLLFIPENIDANYESLLIYPQNKEKLFSNPYFYIKYVDTFCRMINNAISEAFKTISGAQWLHLPYFQWNSAENKIVYNQPTSTPTGTSAPANSKWFVAMNQPLYNLLSTFRFKYFAKNAGNQSVYPENIDCRYLLDTNILFDGTIQPAGEYEIYLQQISSVQTWSPIQSFVFSSTIIPIEAQLTGQPQNVNNIDPTTTGDIYKQQALTKVLTDFIVPLTTGVEQTNQIIYYVPSGEYRLVDLIGNNTLNQLTLTVEWKDKYGVLHPLTIDAGSSSDLLCLLRKKSYNSKF